MCVKQHIYPVLASRRRKLGMSQQELAARAGLRREKLNRIESKGENIGLDELCRVLDAVGLELHVREKKPLASRPAGQISRGCQSPSPSARRLKPKDFRKASFIDGSKAKILSWGKVPR